MSPDRKCQAVSKGIWDKGIKQKAPSCLHLFLLNSHSCKNSPGVGQSHAHHSKGREILRGALVKHFYSPNFPVNITLKQKQGNHDTAFHSIKYLRLAKMQKRVLFRSRGECFNGYMKFLNLQNVCPLGIHHIKQVIKADKNGSYISKKDVGE